MNAGAGLGDIIKMFAGQINQKILVWSGSRSSSLIFQIGIKHVTQFWVYPGLVAGCTL